MEFDESKFYSSLYGQIQSQGCCGRYVDISHRALEKNLPPLPSNSLVLEVGGNLGEHLKYVSHSYEKYIVSDYRKIDAPNCDPKVVFEQQNVEALSYPDESFERVLMGCVLRHVNDPEKGLQQIRRVLKNKGLVSITLPCDPGLLYRIGKHLGPYRAVRKNSPYSVPEYLHYKQHRNHYPGLKSMIYEVFRDDLIQEKSFPTLTRVWNLNLFTIFQIQLNK